MTIEEFNQRLTKEQKEELRIANRSLMFDYGDMSGEDVADYVAYCEKYDETLHRK